MTPFGNHFKGRINFTAGRRQKLGEFQQLRDYLKELAHMMYWDIYPVCQKRVWKNRTGGGYSL